MMVRTKIFLGYIDAAVVKDQQRR